MRRKTGRVFLRPSAATLPARVSWWMRAVDSAAAAPDAWLALMHLLEEACVQQAHDGVCAELAVRSFLQGTSFDDEKAVVRATVERIIDQVTARPPSPDEAEALGIEPGVSLIALRKTSIDTTGRVVEVADVLMAGDRTELVYTTDLTRYPA